MEKFQELEYSGVDSVEDSAGVDFDVYSLSGVKLFHADDEADIKALPSGVYILRYSNGTTRKIVI